VKKIVPALQEVGGSFWRSLSSFRIRLEAMEEDSLSIYEGRKGRVAERKSRFSTKRTKKRKPNPTCRNDCMERDVKVCLV